MNRNGALDSLRSISALMVILLHIASGYVLKAVYANNFDSNFMLANYADSFMRICVPLFVLLSGRFALAKEADWQSVYKGLSQRILLPLLLWNSIYFIYVIIANWSFNHSMNFASVKNDLMNGQSFYHLWYLTMSVGLYLSVPFLQYYIRKYNRNKLILIAMLLMALGMILCLCENYFHFKLFFAFNFVKYVPFFMLGYLLVDSPKLNIFLLITLYVLSSVIIAEVACRTVLHYGNLYSYEYLFPFVVLGALAIYKLFLQIEMRENLLSKMAPYTFGLYLVHAMILDVLNRYLTKSPMQLFNSTLSGMLIKLCIVLPLSFGIVWLLKQNRFLSKLI